MIRTALTENGTVRGLPADDPRVTVFRGIPFAAPPTGENRWRAPQRAVDWEGVRKCYEFGPISMQDRPGVGTDIYCREWHVDPDIPMSEDCLYLNIWTGAKSTDEKTPVLVWIYGGAYQWGYTAEMEFNGERLARHDIIVVTVAYRLGVFGFLAHPELTADDSAHPTNFGLLDIQAALSWVRRNIAAFGGDPDNITVGGQSAGGGVVSYLIANPANAGMIRKASIFSGLIRNPFERDSIITPAPLETAEKNGEEFISFIGCGSVSEARGLSAEDIRDRYAEFARKHPRFVPCIDGAYVAGDPYLSLEGGKSLDVPLFAGYTKDEFLTNLPTRADTNNEAFEDLLADIREKNGMKQFNIVQDSVRHIARAHSSNGSENPMFTYCFAPSVPGYDDPGAFHSCELWFFFETLQKCWRPYNGFHYALARRMCDYWTNFIKIGDPNGMGYDGQKLPEWKRSDGGAPSSYEMIFTEH
ncbi:MAG: carboxylesterase family protein [Lachnospiraceae bacterium]|nr:carboxylesterase family protein [Lachnospiraceae bacterium]